MGTEDRSKATRRRQPDFHAERGTDPGGAAPSFWPERMTEAVVAEAAGHGLAEDVLGAPLWDRWFERAMEQGVDEELASLGRSLIRVAIDQRWQDDRAADSGLLDEGEDMLELALLDADDAHARWRTLLDDA